MTEPRQPLPRDQAQLFTITGSKTPITRIIAIGDAVSTFTEDAVFQVHTPEVVDPERTLPDPPWTQQKILSHGTAHPTIARVFIQATDAMKTVGLAEPALSDLTDLCWSMAIEILQAQSELEAITPRYQEITAIVDGKKLSFHGKVISPFPTIENLDQAAKSFLLSCKAAVQRIAQVYSLFFGAKISNPRFDLILRHLKANFPDCAPLIALVESEEPKIKKIIELRNGVEHPTRDYKTLIRNFRLKADGINRPGWGHSDEELTLIYEDMQQIPIYLIGVCEAFFLLSLMWHVNSSIPYIVCEIPEAQRDTSCPMRYELNIDKAFFQDPQSSDS